MEQFGRASLPIDSAVVLPTLSRHNFTRGAIPREIITRFEPRQRVKSLFSLPQGLNSRNTNGCAVA